MTIKPVTKWHIQSVYTGQGDDLQPSEVKHDNMKFHHITQSMAQFKISELFISGKFHLIFLDRGWPWVTETTKSEMVGVGDSCNNK